MNHSGICSGGPLDQKWLTWAGLTYRVAVNQSDHHVITWGEGPRVAEKVQVDVGEYHWVDGLGDVKGFWMWRT